MPAVPLESPPVYFPLTRGSYDVTAGLRPLGTDFGNGPMDPRTFQLDADWDRYRQNKLACVAEDAAKHVVRSDLDAPTTAAVAEWFADRLVAEYPLLFSREGASLTCRLTGDAIDLADPWPAFCRLAMQVQEDVCVVRTDESRDWLAAAHVCGPSHWRPADKVGQPFTKVHEPVPGIGPVNRSAGTFVDLMVRRGPFVRFAWGFGTDDRINHHPDPPPGRSADDWRGRRFDAASPTFFLRVERQTTWPLPAVGAAVFTIRVSHVDGRAIRADPTRRDLLRAALTSMSADALAYKGLAGSVDAVVAWLDAAR